MKYRFLREYEFATLKTNEISYGLLVHQSIEAINKQGIKDSETVFDDEIVRDIIEKSSNGLDIVRDGEIVLVISVHCLI